MAIRVNIDVNIESTTCQGEVFRLERELVGILNGYASKLEARLGMINTYLSVSMNIDYRVGLVV